MSKKDRQERIDRLFNEACGRSLEDQKEYLDRECGGDWEIRKEVEKLLFADFELNSGGKSLPDPPMSQLLRDLYNKTGAPEKEDLSRTRTAQPVCEQCGTRFDPRLDQTPARCSHCGDLTQSGINPATAEMDLVGELPKRFQIHEVIGEGSFGIVVKAHDGLLDRDVAIKIPKSEMVSRRLFVREAKIASRLRHENIVTIYDVNDSEDFAFIVSDYIEGISLNRWRLSHELTTFDICKLGITLALAMENAHQQGVIHRDLKPSNIVMDLNGKPNILDFGLSKSHTPSEDSLAWPGTPIGTPSFMPPEQVLGDSEHIDARSDVYALGVILYQLLTGFLPFSGEEIFESICHSKPRSVKALNGKLPRSLNAIVMKTLSKDPVDRYQSAASLAEDLQNFLEGRKVAAYRKFDSRVIATIVKRRGMVVASLLLTASLFAAIYFGWQQFLLNNPTVAVSMNASRQDTLFEFRRFDPATGRLEPDARQDAAGSTLHLPPGFYKVIAIQGLLRQEVFRTIPAKGDFPISFPGIYLKHRSWEPLSTHIKLPAMQWIDPGGSPVAVAFRNSVAVQGGALDLSGYANVSELLKQGKCDIPDFRISRQVFDVNDVQNAFPKYRESVINFEIAAAFAEQMGAALPTIEEYFYLEQKGVTLPNLTNGLLEWTQSPIQSSRTRFDEKLENYPGDLDQRWVVNPTTDTGTRDQDPRLTARRNSVSPLPRLQPEANSGFRLVWR